jgi:acetyl esterase/lipase
MYSHFVIAATLSIDASNVARVAAEHVLDRSMPGPELVLRYGDHPDAVIDVFLPPDQGDEDPPSAAGPHPAPSVDSLGEGSLAAPGTRAPLVVLLHGGYWREEWDRVHLRPLARGLVSAGFVVATPEYRRGPGSWAAMSRDVEASVGAVRGLLDEARPGHIDVEAPFALAGHSAGGHLAMWSGQRAGPPVIRRIVALAPVSDVRYAARAGLDDNAAQQLLGGEPSDVPDAYDSADVLGLRPWTVPVTVIHGDADAHVPVEMNRRVAEGMSRATDEAPYRYVELPGIDHFDLIDPESDAWPTVLSAFTAPTWAAGATRCSSPGS